MNDDPMDVKIIFPLANTEGETFADATVSFATTSKKIAGLIENTDKCEAGCGRIVGRCPTFTGTLSEVLPIPDDMRLWRFPLGIWEAPTPRVADGETFLEVHFHSPTRCQEVRAARNRITSTLEAARDEEANR